MNMGEDSELGTIYPSILNSTRYCLTNNVTYGNRVYDEGDCWGSLSWMDVCVCVGGGNRLSCCLWIAVGCLMSDLRLGCGKLVSILMVYRCFWLCGVYANSGGEGI